MNKVMLIGNVGQDPVIKYIGEGVCVATLSLATTERGYTLPNGTQVPERTEWHNVIFWRKTAEIVEQNVRKGDKIYVEGKIQNRSYDDRQGVRHSSVEIIAESIGFFPRTTSQQPQPQATQPAQEQPLPEPEDKLPF